VRHSQRFAGAVESLVGRTERGEARVSPSGVGAAVCAIAHSTLANDLDA
jgi:hypothetical protein